MSQLTSKIIRFSSGVKYDKEITNHSISVNKIASDTTNYGPYDSNIDFTMFWAHEDGLVEQDSDTNSDLDIFEEIQTL